jgi:hypothetical protein
MIPRIMLLLVLLATALHAQIPPDLAQEYTMDMLNCRAWTADLIPSAKLGYVLGFRDAKTISGSEKLGWTTSGATAGEAVKGLNKLCAAPENGAVPVPDMMLVFAEMFNGASEAYVNDLLETFRKMAAESQR